MIEESLRKVYIPGAVIVVVNATDILYEEAFGHHSLLPSRPMNVNRSIFSLASISKTFIAVAVMQLVERKLVDLDTDINQYLSEYNQNIFHPNYSNHSITLRKLLSHSSSVAVDEKLQNTVYQPGDSAFAKETLADMCFNVLSANTSNWLPRPPGNATLYSNEGTSLAALVVERITEMPYEHYVIENIFKPLNIDTSKTGIRLTDFPNRDELVKHYAYAIDESSLQQWNKEVPQLSLVQMQGNFSKWLYFPFFGFSSYPAGLLRMSAYSLSIFLRMFINNGTPLLSAQSITEMKTVVGGGHLRPFNTNSSSNATNEIPSRRYGLCWHWRTLNNGYQYVGHSGTLPGMTHLMLINEKHTIGVIVLTNGDMSIESNISIVNDTPIYPSVLPAARWIPFGIFVAQMSTPYPIEPDNHMNNLEVISSDEAESEHLSDYETENEVQDAGVSRISIATGSAISSGFGMQCSVTLYMLRQAEPNHKWQIQVVLGKKIKFDFNSAEALNYHEVSSFIQIYYH
ncbi:unnamed protein product [Rotaria magnacalcarata]|uniref:Beta-lactamase-related domain-containing protein n=2 Tax=Rotaria magnacalcarata TaxID=392030 RepID=A0A820A2M8_9BILA|nr:unnamed protein product [Rotaria magnacalcarata]